MGTEHNPEKLLDFLSRCRISQVGERGRSQIQLCVSRRAEPNPAQGSQLRRKGLTVWACSSDRQGQVSLFSRAAKHTCWSLGSRGQWISQHQALRTPVEIAASIGCFSVLHLPGGFWGGAWGLHPAPADVWEVGWSSKTEPIRAMPSANEEAWAPI